MTLRNKMIILVAVSAPFFIIKLLGYSLWLAGLFYVGVGLLFYGYMDYYAEKHGKDKLKDLIYINFSFFFKAGHFLQLIDKKITDRIAELEKKEASLENAVKSNDGRKHIKLEDLAAGLWMRDDSAPARQQSAQPATAAEIAIAPDVPSLFHNTDGGDGLEISTDRLREFIDKEELLSLKSISAPYKKVISEIIKVFDKYGGEPSVVDIREKYGESDEEPDANKPKNQFDALRKVSLLEHSIHVYEQYIAKHGTSKLIKPKAFLAAFAHDMGKMSIYKGNERYATGKHPDSSYQALIQMPGFTELKDDVQEDVKTAVRFHHMSPNNIFAREIADADRRARSKELDAEVLAGGKVSDAVDIDQKPPQKQYAPAKAYDHSEYALTWLNIDILLAEVKKQINSVNKNLRFEAFSWTDGSIYVQVGFIETVIRKLAKSANIIGDLVEKDAFLKDFDDRNKRILILNWLAGELRRRGVINESRVADGYFGNKFDVVIPGKEFKSPFYFTVFLASAFGDLSVFEARRRSTPGVQDIQSVSPAKI